MLADEEARQLLPIEENATGLMREAGTSGEVAKHLEKALPVAGRGKAHLDERLRRLVAVELAFVGG